MFGPGNSQNLHCIHQNQVQVVIGGFESSTLLTVLASTSNMSMKVEVVVTLVYNQGSNQHAIQCAWCLSAEEGEIVKNTVTSERNLALILWAHLCAHIK